MARFSTTFEISSILLFFCFFSSFSEAREHLIGGRTNAWKTPSSELDSLNHWAENSRFLIGDTLVFVYDGSKDSVLQVTKKVYVTCNTSSPIESYNSGNTKVTLERSGPYYFISGAESHCEKGQKVIVVVMSEKHRRQFMAISPAPLPVEFEGPAAAPAPSSDVECLRGGLMGAFMAAVVRFVVLI